jgi:hypothetical protein
MPDDRMQKNAERKFIRHTVDVPLEIRSVEDSKPHIQQGLNVSFGGLAFVADECLEEGDVIELRIPTVEPPFEARAKVAWCHPEEDRFLVGVQFLDASDAFRSRMVQQVCAIENYREEIRRNEGRRLSSLEAASEWIARYAGRFPDAATG